MLNFVKNNLNVSRSGSQQNNNNNDNKTCTNNRCTTFCGCIFIIAGVMLLGYFELDHVINLKNISDFQNAVYQVSPTSPTTNAGKFITFHGTLQTHLDSLKHVRDRQTKLVAKSSVAMKRNVLIRNWREKKYCTKFDSSNKKQCIEWDYQYDLPWTSTVVNTSSFHDTSYQNSDFNIAAPKLCDATTHSNDCSEKWFAPDGSTFVGQFDINQKLIEQYSDIHGWNSMTAIDFERGRWAVFKFIYNSRNGWTIDNSGYRMIKGNEEYQGSVKLSYQQVPANGTVTVLAKQSDQTTADGRIKLEPIKMRGKEYFTIKMGIKTKDEMLNDLKSEPNVIMMVWIMRVGSFVCILLGIGSLIYNRDYTFVKMRCCMSFCPCIECLQKIDYACVLWAVSFIAAVCIWLIVWSTCWVVFQPIYLAIVLSIAIIPIALTIWYHKKKNQNQSHNQTGDAATTNEQQLKLQVA